jgi:hypothetical protein
MKLQIVLTIYSIVIAIVTKPKPTMKLNQRKLLLCLMLSASVSAHAAPVLFPNGNFEIEFLDAWADVSGDGSFIFTGEATGGNPGGYGIIDHDEEATGFGILVSNSNIPTPITSIGAGLQVGRTYTFSQDMIILPGLFSGLPGTNIGGFKVDFYSGTNQIGSTGDMYPTPVGDGDAWATYPYNVTIPTGTDGIKAVLLWGPGSVIGFDNVQVDDAPIPAPSSIPNGDFEIAAGDSWGQNSDGGTFNITFPALGGNPYGYARMEDVSNTGGFAVLVSNADALMPLSELGLAPGQSYKFSQDMKIFTGANLGALKVDFFNGDALISSTGDQTPTLIGTGSTWETYDFEVAVPINATGIKVVIAAGAGSDVGFDDITYDPAPLVVGPITEIPNGDFEAGGDKWFSDFGFGGTFAFSYPASGGNPGGYGVIDHSAPNTGFGVLVSNTNAVIPLSGLGLTPGKAYTFSQDMKIFSGSNIGGLKVDFYNAGTLIGNTGDLRLPVISPGAQWQTYNYTVSIPAGADGLKVVCLWGPGSVIGFDNITFSTTPIVVPPISNPGFELGGAGWSFFQDNTGSSFPATGGNPNGHARMVNGGSGYGVLVANGNTTIPLTTLGISVGDAVTFRQDMKIFNGSNIGKFKVEYYNSVGGKISELEKLTPLIGDGSTWETYTYDFLIPAGTIGVKIVLVAGIGSEVGYDNIGLAAPPAEDFASWISGFPAVGSLTGFNDDADHDGIANGLENFFGTDPGAFSKGLVVASVTRSTLVFTHPQNASAVSDISAPDYRWSTDLQTFHANGASNDGGITTVNFSVNTNIPSSGITTVTATITGTVIPQELFVKVGVSQNP